MFTIKCISCNVKDENGGVIRMDLKPDKRICNKCHSQVKLGSTNQNVFNNKLKVPLNQKVDEVRNKVGKILEAIKVYTWFTSESFLQQFLQHKN